MSRIFLAVLLAGVLGAILRAEPPKDVTARVEYTLKTTRTRDPVLGAAKDKVFVSVWIPEGVKTVRGGICTRFRKAMTSASTGRPRAGTGGSRTFKSILMR